MSSPAEERLHAETRQRELAAERREAELAYLDGLLATPTRELVERALRALGFREPLEFRLEPPEIVFPHTRLTGRDLLRLVRGRSSADWLFADVHTLDPVPPRYRRIGSVVELRGELPNVVVSGSVAPGETLAFEIGLDHREWVVEAPAQDGDLTDVGYVGSPPPTAGSVVYSVSRAAR
jgi:hypothetical protein